MQVQAVRLASVRDGGGAGQGRGCTRGNPYSFLRGSRGTVRKEYDTWFVQWKTAVSAASHYVHERQFTKTQVVYIYGCDISIY